MKLRDGFSGQRSTVLPRLTVGMMEADPVASTLYVTDIGHYPSAAHHFRERREPIDQYVLIYCSDGEGWYEYGGRHYRVGAASYFMLPPGAPHRYGSAENAPWTIYWIHFSGTLAPYYATATPGPHGVSPAADSRIRHRSEIFEELFATLASATSIEALRYATSLLHHYLASFRYINQYRSFGQTGAERSLVDATIHYMEENIERPLSLAALAAYSGYSPSYLSAAFKAHTGHAPMSYLNLLKVRLACRLLDETDMKINNICHKVGISDPYYFSRMFTKVAGMSPTAFRRRHRLIPYGPDSRP